MIEEISYLNKETTHVDANYPFRQGDSIFKIAKNMSSLLTESILDTYQLLDHDRFQKVILLLNSCQTINVYGITHPISVAYDFKLKMRTIGKTVNIVEVDIFDCFLCGGKNPSTRADKNQTCN